MTPKKALPRKANHQSKVEETSSADYFASTKRNGVKTTPKKPKPDLVTPVSTRSSARKKHTNTHIEPDDVDIFSDDDKDNDNDIFQADLIKSGRRKDDEYIGTDSDEEVISPKKGTPIRTKTNAKPKPKQVIKVDSDSDEAFVDDHRGDVKRSSTKTSAPAASKKRKSPVPEDEESDGAEPPKKKVASRSTPKTSRSTKKKEPELETDEMKAIFASIPTVKAPTPPPPSGDSSKFDWRKGGAGNAGPPPGAGSKEIPNGEENCLIGLKFVFTGLLDTISRDDAQALVKRYGGEVTGAPSGKTNYVVLGSDAGPSKLRKIESLKITTINEEGLFELIRKLPANGGNGLSAAKMVEKKKKDDEKALLEAQQLEREEQKTRKANQEKAARAAAARGIPLPPKANASTQLWTTKYAPTSLGQICGNKGQVAKIQKWLDDWPLNRKRKFKIRGADGTGAERAILIHGPPGIGKTSAAHLAAKLAGYDIIESNASDTRSKKLVEQGVSEVLKNTSVAGYFIGAGDREVDVAKKKIVLIMDEVDGMSAGDRGGVGALAKVCKTTSIPIILICNERRIPKMKPFDHVTYDMAFRRPTVQEVRSRVATICAREGLKLPGPVMDALIEGSNKDIRQIINMLSTAKLDQTVMDFDSTKEMSKKWEKHIILKPWDLCHKLLGGEMFASSSKATLNDKIELYFNDHEFSYLMVQENYLSTRPMLANDTRSAKEHKLKLLELVDKAAESISDGDLVDRMIHGSQQQWSLMPTHAVFSTVRPASYISGGMTGQTAFTSWLGNNSKQGKLTRFVKEIQSHMRLRTSGDRHEIRQQYLPVLWTQLVNKLQVEGKEAVEEVIDLMDSYFLTRDDFDFIMELGLGPQSEEKVTIETQTKATFTRL